MAIDSGTAPMVGTDQRGFVRDDGINDVGAYEANAAVQMIFSEGFETGDTTAWSL